MRLEHVASNYGTLRNRYGGVFSNDGASRCSSAPDAPHISWATAIMCLGFADATPTAAADQRACGYVGPFHRRRPRRMIGPRHARKGRLGLKGPDGLATRPSEGNERYYQHQHADAVTRGGQHLGLHTTLLDRFGGIVCLRAAIVHGAWQLERCFVPMGMQRFSVVSRSPATILGGFETVHWQITCRTNTRLHKIKFSVFELLFSGGGYPPRGEGIGLGDVKLTGVAGVWLDWRMIPIATEFVAIAGLTAYVIMLMPPRSENLEVVT
jgi:hypothetical protein